ncbi:unnamed protein product [Cunninghamella blakesleeana]
MMKNNKMDQHSSYFNKDHQHQHWIYDNDAIYKSSTMNYHLPPSPPLSPIDDDDNSSSISFIQNDDDDDDDECASTLSSIKSPSLSSSITTTSSSMYNKDEKKKLNRLSQRTVLDDTLDFLDQYNQDNFSSNNSMKKNKMDQQIEDDGFDEQFFQDMAFLLDHPEICNRPLADVTPLLKQHQLEQSYSNSSCNSLSLMNHHSYQIEKHHHQQQQSKLQSVYQWGRFLSVLSATYVVSLLKGPDDLD